MLSIDVEVEINPVEKIKIVFVCSILFNVVFAKLKYILSALLSAEEIII